MRFQSGPNFEFHNRKQKPTIVFREDMLCAKRRICPPFTFFFCSQNQELPQPNSPTRWTTRSSNFVSKAPAAEKVPKRRYTLLIYCVYPINVRQTIRERNGLVSIPFISYLHTNIQFAVKFAIIRKSTCNWSSDAGVIYLGYGDIYIFI